MKNIALLSLFVWLPLSLFSQTSGKLTTDTTLANQYIRQAQKLDIEDDQKLPLAQKAWNIYSNYADLPESIHAKGLYAYALYPTRGEEARQLALEVIGQAEAHRGDEVHPYSVEARLALMSYEMDFRLDFEKALAYGTSIEPLVKALSPDFFELKYRLGVCYDFFGQQLNMHKRWREMEKVLDQVEGKAGYYANLRYLHLGMLYHWRYAANFEVIEIYGKKALSIIDAEDVWFQTQIALGMTDIDPAYIDLVEQNIPKLSFVNKVQESKLYSDLGMAYYESGAPEKGVAYCQKALEMGKDQPAIWPQYIGHLYLNLSRCYMDMGESQTATQTLEKGLAYSDHYLLHANLAAFYTWIDGETFNALEPFQKAIISLFPAFNSSNLWDTPDISDIPYDIKIGGLVLHGKSYLLYQRLKKQYDELSRPEKIRQLNSILASTKLSVHCYERSLDEIQAYQGALLSHHHQIALLYGYIRLVLYDLYEMEPTQALFDEIFYYTEKRKAIQLVAALTDKKLPADIRQTLTEKERAVKDFKQKVATTAVDSIPYFEDQLFEATKALGTYQEEIRTAFPSLSNHFKDLAFATPADILEALDEETLYLSCDVQYFGDLGDWLHMMALGKGVQKVVNIPQKEILEHVWDLEKLNKTPMLVQSKNRRAFIHHCHQLYRILIEPFKEELEGKKRLLLMVEGHLLRIPFEAFLLDEADKPFHELDYLIRHYDISYHYSGTLYLKTQNRPAVQDGSLVAFAPVFSDGKEVRGAHRSMDFLLDSLYRGTVQNNHFVPLTYSKTEVKTISRMFPEEEKVKLLLEKEATKTNLEAVINHQKIQFLHLSSHGIANLDTPPLSGIACARKKVNSEAIFFANEIEQMTTQVDLVVLGTCESGVGKFSRGEGVMALNRSFLIAGTRNVISSLWKVSDKNSSQLLIGFYKYYLQEMTYAEALRAAKLQMLNDPATASPFFWAPFVLIGK